EQVPQLLLMHMSAFELKHPAAVEERMSPKEKGDNQLYRRYETAFWSLQIHLGM
ncbi:hypothetical protein KIL84_001290, partial [Mauremys mutica]